MLVIPLHTCTPCTHSDRDAGSGAESTHAPLHAHLLLVQDGFPTPELQGLIPNSFEHIFQEVEASTDKQWMVRASYLEIYNEEVWEAEGGHGLPRTHYRAKASGEEDGMMAERRPQSFALGTKGSPSPG